MSRNKRNIVILFIVVILAADTNHICYANAAEPPSIIILVPNAPEDLKICIQNSDSFEEAYKKNKIIETYFVFYSGQLRKDKKYLVKIESEDYKYELYINTLERYNNIYTLNLNEHTVTSGKLLVRSVFLVSMRTILTICLEGLLFWLFGFRKKKSWIAFLVINIVTQGALNISINGFAPLKSYIVFSLILEEILVFTVEILAFIAYVKEHSKLRTVLYVLTANFLSLILGGYIITNLPV